MIRHIILLALASATVPAMAQTSYQAWAEAGQPPLDLQTSSPPATLLGGLTTYPDLASFQAANAGGFTVETFDGGLTAGGALNTCVEPVSSASNDACFTPGDLIAGFSLTSSSGNGVVVLGDGFLGQSTAVIGANDFADTTRVAFSPAVGAVAMDVLIGLPGPGDILISAFDAGDNLIGSFTATTTTTTDPVFAGFSSAVPVARIVIDALGDGGELIDNLQFGTPTGAVLPEPQAVPSMGLVGLGLLVLVTGLVAFLSLRSRQA